MQKAELTYYTRSLGLVVEAVVLVIFSLSLPLPLYLQVGMDELENESIQQWRDSERKVARVTSTLVRIDPEQRYSTLHIYIHIQTLYHIHVVCTQCTVWVFEIEVGCSTESRAWILS